MTAPSFLAEPWFVDRLDLEDHRLRAAGWSILAQPPDRQGNDSFTVNGRPFDTFDYPSSRPDVGRQFWMHPGSELCGFEGTIAHLEERYPDGVLELRRMRTGRPKIERGRDLWFKPDPARHTDLPDDESRLRVIGDADRGAFLASGATDYRRLDILAQECCGRPLHGFERVLDWGVGCGRIARHFPSASATRLAGCDIDRVNVDWCKAHLAGTFIHCGVNPPLPLASESFELIYAVSVFTHLREAMQLRWLEELARVLASGGVVLATVHGQTALDFSHEPREEYLRQREEVRRKGFLVTSGNPQLDGHADHGGEYVNVLHGAEYIRRVWGRYFRVEHILPGYILHHDLVVLTKP